MTTVRPPAVAGRFYPGQTGSLAGSVERLLGNARANHATGPTPKALIVPHAGYVYSGATAANCYASLDGARERIHRVVLLGPAHHVGFKGLALAGVDAFQTPLGVVLVDHEAEAKLAGLDVITSQQVHAQEHSLEVQLPFLQEELPAFCLVPLAVGDATPEAVADVIDALWGGPETLIVVSSDLSHYLPYANAQRVDRSTVRQILDLAWPLTDHSACGARAINGLLLAAARHSLHARLISMCNSGDTAGDATRVVGYAAIAFEEVSDVTT